MLQPIDQRYLSVDNDTRILATAIAYDKNERPDETIFVTSDIDRKSVV